MFPNNIIFQHFASYPDKENNIIISPRTRARRTRDVTTALRYEIVN